MASPKNFDFLHDGNDDDESTDVNDDIILVSSTKQRWEELHDVDHPKKTLINRNNENNNHSDDDNYNDYDDAIIVTINPPIKGHSIRNKNDDQFGRLYLQQRLNKLIYTSFERSVYFSLLLLFIVTVLIIMKAKINRFRVTQPKGTITTHDLAISTTEVKKIPRTKLLTEMEASTTTTKLVTNTTTTKTTNIINKRNCSDVVLIRDEREINNFKEDSRNTIGISISDSRLMNEVEAGATNRKGVTKTVTSDATNNNQTNHNSRINNGDEVINLEEGEVVAAITQKLRFDQTVASEKSIPQSVPLSSCASLSSRAACELHMKDDNQQEKKIQMARQIAQDIRLVQDVLVEHSLCPSMATQLAISLNSSQNIVESQREMFYNHSLLDAHQRQIDRNLSERRHRESLQGAKYDPNWKEKLRVIRNKCYYWNICSGGFGRLWWEVLLIQQFVLGVVPVWNYYYNYNYSMMKNTNNDNDSKDFGNSHLHEDDHLVAAFIKDTLAQICDCQSSTIDQSSNSVAKKAFTDIPKISKRWFSTTGINNNMCNALSANVVKYLVPMNIDSLTCYGYCILSVTILFIGTMILHQGLRIMSVPSLLHHVVNIAFLSTLYGIQRTSMLIITIIMKMFMIDMVDDNNDVSGILFSIKQEQEQKQRSNSMMGCSFVLISLWILMPILSWIRTSIIYHQAEQRVRATADFEASFRAGRVELQRWRLDQIFIRYFLLSIYSALVVWEHTV